MPIALSSARMASKLDSAVRRFTIDWTRGCQNQTVLQGQRPASQAPASRAAPGGFVHSSWRRSAAWTSTPSAATCRTAASSCVSGPATVTSVTSWRRARPRAAVHNQHGIAPGALGSGGIGVRSRSFTRLTRARLRPRFGSSLANSGLSHVRRSGTGTSPPAGRPTATAQGRSRRTSR